jgi:hypothetical protein
VLPPHGNGLVMQMLKLRRAALIAGVVSGSNCRNSLLAPAAHELTHGARMQAETLSDQGDGLAALVAAQNR